MTGVRLQDRFVFGLLLGALIGYLASRGRELLSLVNRRRAAKHQIQDLTREQLYERAQAAEISGRSTMNKDELRAAVEEAENPYAPASPKPSDRSQNDVTSEVRSTPIPEPGPGLPVPEPEPPGPDVVPAPGPTQSHRMFGRLLIRRFRRTLAHLTRRNSLTAASFVLFVPVRPDSGVGRRPDVLNSRETLTS